MQNLTTIPFNNTNILANIFSYVDPLTKQKVLPQISRLFRYTILTHFQTPTDRLEFKNACQNLRDKQRWEFEKSSFKTPFKRDFKKNKKNYDHKIGLDLFVAL